MTDPFGFCAEFLVVLFVIALSLVFTYPPDDGAAA